MSEVISSLRLTGTAWQTSIKTLFDVRIFGTELMCQVMNPTVPMSQREAANAWLAEFVRSDAAWEAGVALLDAGHGAQLQFFGANMVLVKVRSSWASLPAEAQGQLTAAVRCHLSPAPSWIILPDPLSVGPPAMIPQVMLLTKRIRKVMKVT